MLPVGWRRTGMARRSGAARVSPARHFRASARADGRWGMTVAEAVGMLPRRMSGWAAQASLAPNSLTGISVSLGVCAAVWFTAGTRWGNLIGALALCGGYLAGRSAAGQPEVAVSESRLAGVCAVVTECGVCAGLAAGGLAAGGPAAGRIGMWQLATTAVILLAVSQLAVACGRRP